MNNEKEIKDKLLKLFEEIDRQSDEQENEISKLVKKTRNREISPRDAAEQIEHRLHLMAEMARIKEEQ